MPEQHGVASVGDEGGRHRDAADLALPVAKRRSAVDGRLGRPHDVPAAAATGILGEPTRGVAAGVVAHRRMADAMGAQKPEEAGRVAHAAHVGGGGAQQRQTGRALLEQPAAAIEAGAGHPSLHLAALASV